MISTKDFNVKNVLLVYLSSLRNTSFIKKIKHVFNVVC